MALVENSALDVICGGFGGQGGQFAGRAIADFRGTFHTDAKMPGIRGEFPLQGRGGWIGKVFFGVEKKLHKLRADELNGCGSERRMSDEALKMKSVFRGPKGGHESAAGGRGRKGAEVEARDDREGAERADKKLVEIIAGDIFDDAAAAFAELAGAVNKFRADQEVPGGAVGVAKSGIQTGSDDAADGGIEIERHGERKELLLIVERNGKVIEVGACVHAESEVAGIVVGDLVEGSHLESDVIARRRHADIELGAIAAGDDGELFESGEADDFSDFLGRSWSCNGRGKNFVDGVGGANRGIG